MLKLVSGYVPIPGHPRSPEEYKKLGSRLMDVTDNIAVAVQEINQCWLFKHLLWRGRDDTTHSYADNPKKNTVAYHIVQHQKTEWLIDAAYLDPKPDVFAWIDFGIFSVPGITEEIILDFIKRADNERAITIPGCWPLGASSNESVPNWRFCGGLFICPRRYLFELDAAFKIETMRYIEETNNVTWEVNTFARLEARHQFPLWWYKADHNAQLFTNYQPTPHAH